MALNEQEILRGVNQKDLKRGKRCMPLIMQPFVHMPMVL